MHRLIGHGPQLTTLREDIRCAAASNAKVLITGETGSGKELVAAAIHADSARSRGPFIAVNCAGIAESLLESELFGYVRGSFTGAFRDKVGLIVLSDGGTVFLDEVGEMSQRMQAMLLRFLETGEVFPVGGTAVRATDVRVIAATNRDLLAMVRQGTFRQDLYYRLHVMHVQVPPLRDRPEDIPELVDHLLGLATHGGPVPEVSPDALERLCAYPWPGNVRELRNAVERILAHKSSGVIGVADLPQEIRKALPEIVLTPMPPTYQRHISVYEAMVEHRASFWTAVYDPFVRHDLTRDDVRAIVQMGLKQTHGSYKVLVGLFNMEPHDYKRFLNFLQKHGCHMPFQPYRVAVCPPLVDSLHGVA